MRILLLCSSFPLLGISITRPRRRFPQVWSSFCRFRWFSGEWAISQLRQSSIHLLPISCDLRNEADETSLLDTVVLDMIPNPEYLALANSLTFSIAVGLQSHYRFAMRADNSKGDRTSYRTVHHQLSLFPVHSRFRPIFVRPTYRLGPLYCPLPAQCLASWEDGE